MRKVMFFLLILAHIVSTGCFQSNEIYLDVKRQEICSANGNGIYKLFITDEAEDEYYKIFWSDLREDAPTEISLTPLTKGYVVRGGWQDTLIDIRSFRLSKNVKYIIKRAQGDAAASSIRVYTNKDGLLFKLKD